MPRKAAVSVEDAVAVIKKYIIYFLQNELPRYSSDVWKSMSKELGNAWSADVVYTNVRNNRRNILSKAKEELGLLIEEVVETESALDRPSNSILKSSNDMNTSFSSGSSSSESAINHKDYIKIDIILTEDEWSVIKPNENERRLKSRVWTNVISTAFTRQTHIPCAFVFKRSKIFGGASKYYLSIEGKCKSLKCNNKFFGYMLQEPQDNTPVVLRVKTRDTRLEEHDACKRPLNGERRKQMRRELVVEGSSQRPKRSARQNMRIGDEPNYIPSPNALREDKREGVREQLDIKEEEIKCYDLVRAVANLKVEAEFAGTVKGVGLLPFYVFYNETSQTDCYKKYCEIQSDPTVICIDSTGSVVHKFTRLNQAKSRDIILYSIVINFENSTLPIYQMITENHYSEFIYLWLSEWLREGIKPPMATVCNYSRALLSAISMAFNYMPINWYVNDRFLQLTNSEQDIRPIQTYIRVNAAHTVHLVARWECFLHISHYAIKAFFLGCISLMIDATDLNSFEQIFLLTVSVAGSRYIDSEINLIDVSSVEEAKDTLDALIGDRKLDIEPKEEFTDIPAETEVNEPEDFQSEAEIPEIESYIDALILKSNLACQGTKLNSFYLPSFVVSLTRLAKEFPLWTATCIPYKTKRATCSHVKSYFNDVKTRLLRNKLLRADAFLVEHLRDITAGSLVFLAKLKRLAVSKPAKEKKTREAISVMNHKDTNECQINENVQNALIWVDFELPIVSSTDEIPSCSTQMNCNMPLGDSDSTAFENVRRKGKKRMVDDNLKEGDNDDELFINNDLLVEHFYSLPQSTEANTVI